MGRAATRHLPPELARLNSRYNAAGGRSQVIALVRRLKLGQDEVQGLLGQPAKVWACGEG